MRQNSPHGCAASIANDGGERCGAEVLVNRMFEVDFALFYQFHHAGCRVRFRQRGKRIDCVRCGRNLLLPVGPPKGFFPNDLAILRHGDADRRQLLVGDSLLDVGTDRRKVIFRTGGVESGRCAVAAVEIKSAEKHNKINWRTAS
jgi:hypothetical protein